MNASQIYIALSIVTLAIIILLALFLHKRKKERNALTPLTGIAFSFVLAGILFGDDRLVGYSLLAVGVLLAVIDMLKKVKA